MKKFKYKVLKPFSIFEDEKGNRKIAETDEEKRSGTSFSKNAKFVDYRCESEDITQDPFTHELCEEGYIEFIKERELETPNVDEGR